MLVPGQSRKLATAHEGLIKNDKVVLHGLREVSCGPLTGRRFRVWNTSERREVPVPQAQGSPVIRPPQLEEGLSKVVPMLC